MEKVTVREISYHRNGICGIGFHVVLFDWKDEGIKRSMVATIFPEKGACAVLDVTQTAEGNIAFAMGNSWRGDHFEGSLRKAIDASDKGKLAPFAIAGID